MNTRQRTFVILTLLLLQVANAHDQRWYNVPATDKSFAEQIIAISRIKPTVGIMFEDTHFWDSPALHDVHGWFTPLEAFCIALAGTPLEPVVVSGVSFVFHRYSDFPDEPQRCEYATADWGPEWIHPPQADWK